jgi:hypothetical protein
LQTPLWDLRAIFHSEIWDPFRKDPKSDARMLAHFALGTAIVVLALILLIASHFAARKRFLIGLLSLLLLAVIAGQIGVGMLLLYDGDSGPLTQFNPPSSSAATSN